MLPYLRFLKLTHDVSSFVNFLNLNCKDGRRRFFVQVTYHSLLGAVGFVFRCKAPNIPFVVWNGSDRQIRFSELKHHRMLQNFRQHNEIS
jgi:hypothetical protein